MRKLLSTVLFFILSFLMMGGVNADTIYNDTEKIKVDYYYSPTCGWCKKLDEYIEENNISSKVEINKIDVGYQGELFVNIVEELGLNQAEVGVPFLVYIKNGKKEYVKGGYYGGISYFSELLEQKVTLIKSKAYFQKQKIVSKNYLNKNLQTQKYIKAIDRLVSKTSDKKLESVSKKLENFSYVGKSEKITNVFKYLEAKITEEIFNRLHIVVKDFGHSLQLEQTNENTYLTNKGKTVYTWKHESKKNPYIWDEACEPVWKIFDKEGNKDKQGVWNRLSDNEQQECLKEDYQENISVSEIINKDFIMFYEQGYESGKTYLLDMKTNHVIDLNRSTEVSQVEKNKYGTFVLHGLSGYGTAEVMVNYGKANIVLFENNSDVGDINDSEYRQIKSFVLIDYKIQIEYIGQYGNSEIKIINLEI